MFSLIVTTQGNRTNEFERFLISLQKQQGIDYELIVIDQSLGTEVEDLCRKYTNTRKYIRSNGVISLSKARNIGLENAEGNIVAFPDDDCWYPDNLLYRIQQCFEKEPEVDCFCFCAYDPIKKRSLSNRKTKSQSVNIHTINALKYPISIGIFSKISPDVKFDEELGAGTKWGSGEETDYILQLLKKGKKIKYISNILVYHPYNNDASEIQEKKMYKYGQGYGALIKKAVKRGQITIILDLVIVFTRSLGGYIMYKLKGNTMSNIYKSRLKGILNGIVYS